MIRLMLIGLAVVLCAAASTARAQEINPQVKVSQETLALPALLPDLVVSSVIVTPEVEGKSNGKITITVKNNCEGYAKPAGEKKQGYFNVSFRGEKVGTPIALGWSMGVKGLKGGESSTFSVDVPDGLNPVADLHWVIEVDSLHTIKEVNEANNFREVNPNKFPPPDGPTPCKLKKK